MPRFPRFVAGVVALAAVVVAGAVPVNEDPAFFPFVIPWEGVRAGSAVDVSAMNGAGPAGSRGPVVVRDGVFVTAADGERVRFLAMNLGAAAVFPPTAAEAEAVARRLAQLGVNLVRLHHLQNSWDRPDGMIWKDGRIYVEIDPVQVDRMDRLIAALKRHGIYTNLNLSTTRDYVPEVGFPDSVAQIPFTHHKRVDKFNRRMIELQQEYARALLDRVNPYTGLRYAEDPALAFLEINNENSLVGWAGQGVGEGLDLLPEPFRAELIALWNAWLAGRYADDAALEAAWSERATGESGPNLLSKVVWVYENQGAADLAEPTLVAGAAGEGPGKARVELKKPVSVDWMVQVQLPGLSLKDGEGYTLRFRARAEAPRSLPLKVHLDRPSWDVHGLQTTVRLETEWQEYVLPFVAEGPVPGRTRVAFLLSGERPTVEIEGVSLRRGKAPWKRPEGQSLVLGNVALGGGTGRRMEDWTQFLVGVERSYSEAMRRFLREDLEQRALIIDSQIQWGGSTALVREASMDYTDTHGYWQHPSFLTSAWDPENWVVGRKAQVDALAAGGGLVADLAAWRVAGRPFSVSEYDHPAPNDLVVEMLPLVTTAAGRQDWDKIYLFAYPETRAGRPNDRITGFFDQALHPAKAGFLPAAAVVFRNGLVPPAVAASTVRLPELPWRAGGDAGAIWGRLGGQPDVLGQRAYLAVGAAGDGAARRRDAGKADRKGVRLETGERGAVLVVDEPAVQYVAGYVGGRSMDVGGARYRFGSFGRDGEGFGAVALVETRGAALSAGSRWLLTACGRAENVGMQWNADRTSVGTGWGAGPVHAEGVPFEVELALPAGTRAWALAPDGSRREEVPVTRLPGNRAKLELGPKWRTIWYEIGVE